MEKVELSALARTILEHVKRETAPAALARILKITGIDGDRGRRAVTDLWHAGLILKTGDGSWYISGPGDAVLSTD